MDEAPEPFRRVLSAHLSPADSIRLLVFSPADETFDKRPPSTLLAVTTSGWVVVADADGGPTAVRCDFADTLLVELTNILLYGRLKIDFVAEGRTQSVAIEFSTVTDRLFQEAVQLLLDGMDGISAAIPIEDSKADSLLCSLPLKFWNAVIEFRPVSQPVLAVLHWPALLGGRRRWFQRELAPEAILVLTGRELMVISEEKTWSWLRIGHINKYGCIATHCPLSRLKRFQINERGQLNTLELELRAKQDGAKVEVPFPSGQRGDVSTFMERVLPPGGL
ncbi:MAG: hypothetical protein ACLPYZ_11185 [Limisphaerales bacterium]